MDLKNRVLQLLFSADKPMTRQTLCEKLGVGDRQLRSAISELRKTGCPVVSTSGKKGYYMAKTTNDMELVIREYRSKALDMLKTMHTLIKGQQCDGQISVEEAIRILYGEEV